MAKNLLEDMHVVQCSPSAFIAAAEDFMAGNPATDVIDMSLCDEVLFIVQKMAGAVGTGTITIESCDDTTPTTPTAVAFRYRKSTTPDVFGAITAVASTGILMAAGADEIYLAHIKANELSGTDRYVRMQLTETDSTAVDGGVIAICGGMRYLEDVTPVTLIP
jgi:hypothetical protein